MVWCRTNSFCPVCASSSGSWIAASLARSFRCAASLVIGSLRAIGSLRNGLRGTTASKTAAASSSTCSAIGAMCWTTHSAGFARCSAWAALDPERVDENGNRYECTADDTAYGTFELDGGIVAQINSSWSFRVYRDELFSLQVDGTLGSAVAGLRECRDAAPCEYAASGLESGHRESVPIPRALAGSAGQSGFDNGFKVQWELFLRHVAEDVCRSLTIFLKAPEACNWPSWV